MGESIVRVSRWVKSSIARGVYRSSKQSTSRISSPGNLRFKELEEGLVRGVCRGTGLIGQRRAGYAQMRNLRVPQEFRLAASGAVGVEPSSMIASHATTDAHPHPFGLSWAPRRAVLMLGWMLAIAATALCLRAPTAGASFPLSFSAPASFDPGQTPSAISCPSRRLCIAVDQTGEVISTADPLAPSPSWSTPTRIDHGLNPGQVLSSLSCPSESLCVAVDGAGSQLTSLNPAGGGGTWRATSIDGGTLSAVSCASSSLCVAVDDSGHALSSTDPAAANPTWTSLDIDTSNPLRAISCPTESLCVAVDEAGNVLSSTNPAAADASWQTRQIDPGRHLQAVSCSATGPCVVFDSSGNVLASENPASSTPTWSTTAVELSGTPESVSCTAAGLCVAGDSLGNALMSDGPAAAIPAWSQESLDSAKITGVSCLAEGFCMAVDAAGRAVQGFVAAPLASTGGATEITSGEANLSATINPNDAQISDCRFEYGLTAEYGQSVSCSSQPVPTAGEQAVVARLKGLASASTYHFRLSASDAAGTSTGADKTFTTAAAVSVVYPSPSIVGVPAVGERLRCLPGVSSTTVALTYLWIRDSKAISGTNSSIYLVRSADAKHHLQCKVTATDAAGSASASSAFVAVPAQGIIASVGETLVGKARMENQRVLVPLRCSPQAAGSCAIELRLTLTETRRGSRIVAVSAAKHTASPTTSRVRVTLASARVHLAPGQRLTVSMTLTHTARALLARMRRLPAELTVTGTVIGAIRASLARQQLTLGVILTRSASRRR